MKKQINIFLFLVFITIVFFACDDTDLTNIEFPDEDISYSEHLQPVFNVKCADEACHSSYTYAGGYSMSSWTETKTPPYIREYDSEHSTAYLAAASRLGIPMPPVDYVRPGLTENELKAFKTWIDEGAKNN